MSKQRADWRFIQSVGGMQVGDPSQVSDNCWSLPIEFDVSGKAFTVQPTTINSSIVVRDLRVKIKERNIFIWVIYSLPYKQEDSSAFSESIILHNLESGLYSINYLNPDGSDVAIRQFDID